jgi:hypothetical protein
MHVFSRKQLENLALVISITALYCYKSIGSSFSASPSYWFNYGRGVCEASEQAVIYFICISIIFYSVWNTGQGWDGIFTFFEKHPEKCTLVALTHALYSNSHFVTHQEFFLWKNIVFWW